MEEKLLKFAELFAALIAPSKKQELLDGILSKGEGEDAKVEFVDGWETKLGGFIQSFQDGQSSAKNDQHGRGLKKGTLNTLSALQKLTGFNNPDNLKEEALLKAHIDFVKSQTADGLKVNEGDKKEPTFDDIKNLAWYKAMESERQSKLGLKDNDIAGWKQKYEELKNSFDTKVQTSVSVHRRKLNFAQKVKAANPLTIQNLDERRFKALIEGDFKHAMTGRKIEIDEITGAEHVWDETAGKFITGENGKRLTSDDYLDDFIKSNYQYPVTDKAANGNGGGNPSNDEQNPVTKGVAHDGQTFTSKSQIISSDLDDSIKENLVYQLRTQGK